MSSPGRALRLPEQLIFLILHYCDFKDIVRCRGVCPDWRGIIDSSKSLEYIVWLGICYLDDEYPSAVPLSSRERLALLISRKTAWESFKPRRYDIISTPYYDFLHMKRDSFTLETRHFVDDTQMADLLKYERGTTMSNIGSIAQCASSNNGRLYYEVRYCDWETGRCVIEAAETGKYKSRHYLRDVNHQDSENILTGARVFDVLTLACGVIGEEVDTDFDRSKALICGQILFIQQYIYTRSRANDPCVPFVAIWNWTTETILATYAGHHSVESITLLSSTPFVVISCARIRVPNPSLYCAKHPCPCLHSNHAYWTFNKWQASAF
ncbi:hypothetical protein DL93DRAFT_413145 [Clavulina sp. PMI_390]|nr:hypothetical protein DL93DRAFT_413145 [Clavulina sp. PMI_390]